MFSLEQQKPRPPKLYEEYGMTSTDIWDMSDRNDKEWHSFADAVVYLGYGDLILGQNSSPVVLSEALDNPILF
jgi:hypothetical protein